MNEPNEYLSDEHLDRLLQPHRDINVPPEAQAANRAAIRRQLAPRIRPPWWKRTIALPVPVAIAASILLLLAAAAITRLSVATRTSEQTAWSAATGQPTDGGSETSFTHEQSMIPAWSIQRSFIRTLTSSAVSAPVALKNLENRDDS